MVLPLIFQTMSLKLFQVMEGYLIVIILIATDGSLRPAPSGMKLCFTQKKIRIELYVELYTIDIL